MRTAIFTGTFDPPTLGHLDIVRRASALFDKLYVAVARGNVKRPLSLSLEERVELWQTMVTNMKNVEVVSFSGLAVDCALERRAQFIVRGIRNGADVDIEAQMAAANRQLTGVETVLFFSSPQYSHLSSTLIREIAGEGRQLKGFVPEAIEEAVFRTLTEEKRK